MTTILYIPLDERPCNLIYPQALLESTRDPNVLLKTPPIRVLGEKKKPTDLGALWNWLEEEAPTADMVLCSLDMLFFGGIVPSRLHHKSELELRDDLQRFMSLKEIYPRLRIYAFNLIMRVPAYNLSDEEPDYYREYGERIFRWGWYSDMLERGEAKPETKQELDLIMASIPQEVRDDYQARRRLNHLLNKEALSLVKQGILDFLVIPLDDCAEYGFSAAEQKRLLKLVEKDVLHAQVHIYPGADEVGMALLGRMYNELKGSRPRIFVRYSSTLGPSMIPRYEDRPLGESIKSQITVLGGIMVDNSQEADLILMVNSPTLNHGRMQEASQAVVDKDPSYYSFRNLREFVESINYYIQTGRKVALADVAYGNGADHELMQMLHRAGLLNKLYSYAAWNTPGNTLGTALAHSVLRLQESSADPGKPCKFVYDRYLEDWGYQVLVRSYLRNEAERLGITYFDLKDEQPKIRAIAFDLLQDFLEQYSHSFSPGYKLDAVHFPWNRLFEIGLQTTLR
ncbi:MAG: DUF4127 family protein [Firmicutes bacterium]|nr:DUF4127 family protein [Bacillota bacterium]